MRGLNAPPRRMLAPAALTVPAISSSIASLSMAHGPAIMARCAAADLAPCLTSTTVSSGVELAAGQLERLQDRQHLLDAGDGRQRLGLQLVLVADDADDGAMLAPAEVRLEAQLADALEDVVDLGRRRSRFQDDDHDKWSAKFQFHCLRLRARRSDPASAKPLAANVILYYSAKSVGSTGLATQQRPAMRVLQHMLQPRRQRERLARSISSGSGSTIRSNLPSFAC